MSSTSSSPAPNATAKANQIGHSFITTYYHTLSENTTNCFKFYKNNSQLSHEPDVTYSNTNEIKDYFSDGSLRCKFAGALINLEHGNFDVQPSFGGGVLICITGQMTLKDDVSKVPKSFVHTFFLGCENVTTSSSSGVAKQRYYVLNEVLRFAEAAPVSDTAAADVVIINETPPADIGKATVTAASEVVDVPNNNEIIQRGEEETKDEISIVAVADETVAEANLVEQMKMNASEPFAASSNTTVTMETVSSSTRAAVESSTQMVVPDELSAVEQVALSNAPIQASVQEQPSKPKSWASLLSNSSSKTVSSSPARSNVVSSGNNVVSASSNNAKLFQPKQEESTDVSTSLAESVTESSQKDVEVEATVVPGTGGKTFDRSSNSNSNNNFGACSLYVSNVNRDVSEKGLRALFDKYGFRIVNVTVAQTRGFAFLDFSDPNAAEVILKQGGNTYTLNGRQITVEKKNLDRARGGRSGKNGSGRRSSPRGGGGHRGRSSRGGKNKAGGNKQGQPAASVGSGSGGG